MTTAISRGVWWNPEQPGCIVLGPPFIILGPSFPPDQSTNDGVNVSGNQGDDHLVGGAGNDRLDGYQGNDTLEGGDGDDHLDGYQDDNLLIGGNGNDTLTGGSGGHHTLEGGAGDDVYETTNGYFYDISDTSGTDTVEFVWGLNQLTGLYRVGASTQGTAGNDLLLRFGGTDVLIRNYFVLGENGGHIENLKIRDFAVHAPDAFVTWQLQDVLNALNNPQPSLEDEYIYGTDGNDVIDGGTGDDYLNGHGGNDTLIGGDGNDTLNGHADHDSLMGGKGDDIYQSSSLTHADPFEGIETEVIADTGGTDTVQLSGVNPTGCTFIRSDEDDLIISFGNGNSLRIERYFTEGPDSGYIENLDFGSTVWHMADVLKVAVIRCGTPPLPAEDPPHSTDSNGAQTNIPEAPEIAGPCPPAPCIVVGKTGKELLSGSAAADVFQFASAKMAGLRKSADIIVDFEHGVDTIDLSGIDANTKVAGDNAFKALLTGKKPFSKAGQLHYDKKTGILSGNTDKDAAAEFQIQFKNKPYLLKLSDFIL